MDFSIPPPSFVAPAASQHPPQQAQQAPEAAGRAPCYTPPAPPFAVPIVGQHHQHHFMAGYHTFNQGEVPNHAPLYAPPAPPTAGQHPQHQLMGGHYTFNRGEVPGNAPLYAPPCGTHPSLYMPYHHQQQSTFGNYQQPMMTMPQQHLPTSANQMVGQASLDSAKQHQVSDRSYSPYQYPPQIINNITHIHHHKDDERKQQEQGDASTLPIAKSPVVEKRSNVQLNAIASVSTSSETHSEPGPSWRTNGNSSEPGPSVGRYSRIISISEVPDVKKNVPKKNEITDSSDNEGGISDDSLSSDFEGQTPFPKRKLAIKWKEDSESDPDDPPEVPHTSKKRVSKKKDDSTNKRAEKKQRKAKATATQPTKTRSSTRKSKKRTSSPTFCNNNEVIDLTLTDEDLPEVNWMYQIDNVEINQDNSEGNQNEQEPQGARHSVDDTEDHCPVCFDTYLFQDKGRCIHSNIVSNCRFTACLGCVTKWAADTGECFLCHENVTNVMPLAFWED